jgi:penicillin-binding protein 1A
VLRLYAFIALVAIALVVIAGALAYRYIALTTPPAPDLSQLVAASPGISRTYAADGTKLDEFALEWRHPVPYDQIPPRLIDAVIAIEDHEFFEHRGIYWKGIVRAAWRNVVAGDFEQGGSTITQQVAKQLVGSDKSLSRKAHEAVLAMRLERRNSKKAILAYYLNQIYLGGGAYGVAGAAERYFGKRLDELTLAEMALIAGLPKAPSAFSPLVSPERAIKRRNTVLDQMVRWGKLDAATADAAKAEPLKLAPYDSVFPDRLPYYANHIRTALLKHPRYGYRAGPDQPAWVELAGLRVETAAEPSFEAGAYDNVDYGTRKQDKRQGWRGPVWYVDGPAKDTLLERQRQLYGAGPLTPGRRYLGGGRRHGLRRRPCLDRRSPARAAAAQPAVGVPVERHRRPQRQGDLVRHPRPQARRRGLGPPRDPHARSLPRVLPARRRQPGVAAQRRSAVVG